MAENLATAVDLLSWAQSERDRHDPQRSPGVARWEILTDRDVRYGDLRPLQLVENPPSLVVVQAFDKLPPKGWRGCMFPGDLRLQDRWNQPRGPFLYPRAARVAELVSADHDVLVPLSPLPHGSRVHRIAILRDPAEAPSTIDGTQALVVAAVVSSEIATAITQLAEIEPLRSDEARRFRSEVAALEKHRDACLAALPRSLSWADDFARSITPLIPFAPPVVPAELRGRVTVSLTQ